jgi:hypothetical protein
MGDSFYHIITTLYLFFLTLFFTWRGVGIHDVIRKNYHMSVITLISGKICDKLMNKLKSMFIRKGEAHTNYIHPQRWKQKMSFVLVVYMYMRVIIQYLKQMYVSWHRYDNALYRNFILNAVRKKNTSIVKTSRCRKINSTLYVHVTPIPTRLCAKHVIYPL